MVIEPPEIIEDRRLSPTTSDMYR